MTPDEMLEDLLIQCRPHIEKVSKPVGGNYDQTIEHVKSMASDLAKNAIAFTIMSITADALEGAEKVDKVLENFRTMNMKLALKNLMINSGIINHSAEDCEKCNQKSHCQEHAFKPNLNDEASDAVNSLLSQFGKKNPPEDN
jgi:hypothetical protein